MHSAELRNRIFETHRELVEVSQGQARPILAITSAQTGRTDKAQAMIDDIAEEPNS